MKRVLILAQILGGGLLAFAALPVSMSNAEPIACAAEPDVKGGGHWYYRILDGRKCWYRGKPMMPRESLYWPKSTDAAAPRASDAQAARRAQAAASDEEAAASAKENAASETDGRNAAVPARAAEPASWPSPLANEISFESRWLGLHARP